MFIQNMFIQKLLHFQTISGPYLGQTDVQQSIAAKALPFILPQQSPKSSPLQSVAQQLDIRLQPTPRSVLANTPSPHTLPSPESVRLCPVTLHHLQSHPVTMRGYLSMVQAIQEPTIPAPTSREMAQEILLTFLALERPFEPRGSLRSKRVSPGRSFFNAHTAWEEREEEDPEEEAQA